MHARILQILAILSAVLLPVGVEAQTNGFPPVVTGIQATYENRIVSVSWDPATTDIAYYRVYFSNESILENGGAYDDFEPTSDALPHLSFTPSQKSGMFYVAVLAVNQEGDESLVFVEEAQVDLGSEPSVDSSSEEMIQGASASSLGQSSHSSEAPLPEVHSDTLSLLTVDVLSSQEVLLQLSVEPVIEDEDAPDAFLIRKKDGEPLVVTSIVITGTQLLANTEEQVAGQQYDVVLLEPFEGADGQPLDSVLYTIEFQGHKNGKAPELVPEKRPSGAAPPSIKNLQSKLVTYGDNTYAISLRWEIDDFYNDLLYYGVRQSRDDGNTFGPLQLLSFDIQGIDIPIDMTGEYGFALSVVNSGGYMSPAVFTNVSVTSQSILSAELVSRETSLTDGTTQITDGIQMDPPAVGNLPAVETPVEKSPSLAQTGMGIALGLLGVGGLGSGWYVTRRRKLRE